MKKMIVGSTLTESALAEKITHFKETWKRLRHFSFRCQVLNYDDIIKELQLLIPEVEQMKAEAQEIEKSTSTKIQRPETGLIPNQRS